MFHMIQKKNRYITSPLTCFSVMFYMIIRPIVYRVQYVVEFTRYVHDRNNFSIGRLKPGQWCPLQLQVLHTTYAYQLQSKVMLIDPIFSS